MPTHAGRHADDVLLVRLAKRDTADFAVLYDRYARLAFGYAMRLLGAPETAEAVVQEAFLSVWRAPTGVPAIKIALPTGLLALVYRTAHAHRGERAGDGCAHAWPTSTA